MYSFNHLLTGAMIFTHLLGSFTKGYPSRNLEYFDATVNAFSDGKKSPSTSIYTGCINLFYALYVPTKKPSRSLIHSVSDTQMQLPICKITESIKI